MRGVNVVDLKGFLHLKGQLGFFKYIMSILGDVKSYLRRRAGEE
jgi:hypothetical protein